VPRYWGRIKSGGMGRVASFMRTVWGFLARVFISEPKHMGNDEARTELEMLTHENRSTH